MDNSVERHGKELAEIFSKNKFVVFLCGPTINDMGRKSSVLRKLIKEELEKENFEVVLGEDDGLELLRKDYDFDAQTNELNFIDKQSHAIILIADSPGSFCELGLFSDWFKNKSEKRDFILIVHKDFKPDKSYLNLGPAELVKTMGGLVVYNEFSPGDIDSVIVRLKRRRAVYLGETRGRKIK